MNQVDLLIVVIVAASAWSGARRGIICSAGDVIGLAAGLVVGSLAYPIGAVPMTWFLGKGSPVAGALGFILVAIGSAWLLGWGFGRLAEQFEPPPSIGRVGGAFFGGALGILLAAVILLASGILPGSREQVSQSALGPRIIVFVPRLHENMERIGIPLPKLVQLPTDYREELSGVRQGLQFLRINFTRLDGAMCIHCRTPVQFVGYQFVNGTLMSPKFVCPKCGRTSDGCQTFEGFHAIYTECPVDLAREGVEFDCGVWTNGWFTVPHGKCPVCGKEFKGAREAPAAIAGQRR